MERQNEIHEEFSYKEQQMEQRMASLEKKLADLTHEVELRERQLKKNEGKLLQEVQKQAELQQQIDSLARDKINVVEQKSAVMESYDVLEEKLRQTQALLDTKVSKVDCLEREVRDLHDKADKLEVLHQRAESELAIKSGSIEQLTQDHNYLSTTLLTLEEQLKQEKAANAGVQSELNKVKTEEERLRALSTEQASKIDQLEALQQNEKEETDYLQKEIKQYQDSLSFLSKQLDCEKLRHLDYQVLE